MRSCGSITIMILAPSSLSGFAAGADDFPVHNVTPLCRGIIQQSDLQDGLKDVSLDECLKAEPEDRQTMIKEWSTFSVDDREHRIAEARIGGESSYTDLVTGLEVTRDVRTMGKSDHTESSTQNGAQS